MILGRNPVGAKSKGAAVKFDDESTPEDMQNQINDAIDQVKVDIQGLAGLTPKGVTTQVHSGNFRLVAPAAGVIRVKLISDTATAGSTGAIYHVFSLRLNGAAVGTQTIDTRRAELPAYLGGVGLGEVPVAAGDVLSVLIAVTGAPAPTLTTANLCLSCTLRSN